MKAKPVLAVVCVSVFFFLIGNLSGFFLGVWSTEAGKEFLEDVVTSEEPADVSRPQRCVRKGFLLEYPKNWHIDTTDEDFDPDHMFSIDSPGSAFTMLTIFDIPVEPAMQVDEQIAQLSKLISNPKERRFKNWGKYKGEGVDLHGRMLGMKVEIKIFATSSNNKSFLVVNQCFDEDLADAKPGFKLIESSFELKN